MTPTAMHRYGFAVANRGVPALQGLPSVPEAYREILVPSVKFTVALAAVYLFGRLLVVPGVNEVVRRRNQENPTIQAAIDSYLRLLVVLVGIVVGIAAAGYGRVVTGSALIVAALTLAIGVAGQEVMGALISGLFLVANPNFGIGDTIAWNDRIGVVEAISFRTTVVRTPENETLTVPNTELTTSTVARPFGREKRRLSDEVGIAYEDDLDAALSGVLDATAGTPAVLDDPEPQVLVSELGDDEVVLEVFYWIADPTQRDVLRVRSTVARNVKSTLEGADVTISPATQRELSGSVGVDDERVS